MMWIRKYKLKVMDPGIRDFEKELKKIQFTVPDLIREELVIRDGNLKLLLKNIKEFRKEEKKKHKSKLKKFQDKVKKIEEKRKQDPTLVFEELQEPEFVLEELPLLDKLLKITKNYKGIRRGVTF